jgi:hypothetical protein
MEIKVNGAIAEITYKDRGRIYNKSVDFDDLIDSLAEKAGISTPILPFGTKIYSKNNGLHNLVIEMLPTRRNIKYVHGDRTIFEGMIPLPFGAIIMGLREIENKFKIDSIRIFALDGPIMSKDDPLYNWPTPNVFQQGNICWGNGSSTLSHLSKLDHIHQAGRIIDLFFSGSFNNHIHPNVRGYNNNFPAFAKSIENKQTFDTGVLTPHGTYIRNYL